MTDPSATDPRRAVPSVDRVAAELGERHPSGHALRVSVAREAVDEARRRAGDGHPPEPGQVTDDAELRLTSLLGSLLRPVINATGVLVHTNLGRAPLSAEALAAVARVGAGYSNLEYRLDEGRRGSRHEHAGSLVARICGAEAGLVVNNNAAAVLLVLAALARGREVVVSRGELVEIGGGFRVPDVMAESGASLVEVGTTNRTRLADYTAAVGPATALILKVHASNYRIVGFTESTPLGPLGGLGPPLVVDAGSGLLDATTPWLAHGPPAWLEGEPGVRQCLADGASLVLFSGDKLFGGPQAGIVVGRRDLVDAVARHPLARAVRADKLTLAACQETALAYLSGRAGDLPLWRMAAASASDLAERARAIVAALADVVGGSGGDGGATVVDLESVPGGGSAPGAVIPSAGLALPSRRSAEALLAALRDDAVVARIDDDRVVCDLRTVDEADDPRLTRALAAAWAAGATDPVA